MASARMIRLAVDIGGTFTDVALDAPQGRVTAKVLTTPQAPERGVMEGVNAAAANAGCRCTMSASLFTAPRWRRTR